MRGVSTFWIIRHLIPADASWRVCHSMPPSSPQSLRASFTTSWCSPWWWSTWDGDPWQRRVSGRRSYSGCASQRPSWVCSAWRGCLARFPWSEPSACSSTSSACSRPSRAFSSFTSTASASPTCASTGNGSSGDAAYAAGGKSPFSPRLPPCGREPGRPRRAWEPAASPRPLSQPTERLQRGCFPHGATRHRSPQVRRFNSWNSQRL